MLVIVHTVLAVTKTAPSVGTPSQTICAVKFARFVAGPASSPIVCGPAATLIAPVLPPQGTVAAMAPSMVSAKLPAALAGTHSLFTVRVGWAETVFVIVQASSAPVVATTTPPIVQSAPEKV